MFAADENGAVELYYDNSKKFETTSTGNKITGQLEITGGSDEQLMLKGTTPFIRWYESGTQKAYAQWNSNGYLELHNHETSKGFRVGGQGVEVLDNIKFTAGDSQDLQIYHDGTYNVIKGTGNHRMDFYTNGTLRTCIQSDGHLRPASNNTYDLGTSVDRWRNIYTNDLNLSNEGSSNDMDGTWGNWTIQEGESDLFLKNNRSGKKYKFNLTEVS
jgi:hypothetical protein